VADDPGTAAPSPHASTGEAPSDPVRLRRAVGAIPREVPPLPNETTDPGEAPLTVHFQETAALVEPSEVRKSFEQFKLALFQVIDSSNPPIIRETTKSNNFFLAYTRGLFSVAPLEKTLSYDQLVAKYVSLWSTLEKPELQQFSMQALLGIRSLIAGRLSTSSSILSEIEFQTSTPVALTYVMRGVGVFIRTLFFISLFIGYPLLLSSTFSWSANQNPILTFLGETGVDVLVAAISGMLGSVVSILLRLSEFETTKGRSQMFLLLTGATLPFVGGVFAAFIAALLSAKLINIGVGGSGDLNVWLYVVIGFLSGFSERFSRGFVKIAEHSIGGTSGPPPTPNTNDVIVSRTAKLDVVSQAATR
jgi:hypothetical protein